MISPTPPPSLFTGYASSFFTTPIHPYTLLCQRERDHSSTFVGLSTHKVSALSVSRVVLLLFYILLSVSYVAVLLPRSGAIAHPRGAPRTSTSAHHSATLHTHTSDKKKKKEKNAMTLTRFFPVSSLAMSTSLSLSLSLCRVHACMCVSVFSRILSVSVTVPWWRRGEWQHHRRNHGRCRRSSSSVLSYGRYHSWRSLGWGGTGQVRSKHEL